MKPIFSKLLSRFAERVSRRKLPRPHFPGMPSLPTVARVVRRHWVVGAAVLAAAAAFLMTQNYATTKVLQERERLLPQGGLVEVLVAARDLTAGDVVSPLTVAVRRMPQDWSLPNSVTPLDFEAIHQRPLIRPLKAGHPITTDHLRSSADVAGGFRLEPGFRAVSIPVDEVSSVGGLIQPGDRVDLWSSVTPIANQSEGAIISLATERLPTQPQARLIAENLLVLATGGKTDRAVESSPPSSRGVVIGSAYSTLTLSVPAGIANLVLGGQLQGRMGVALRAAEAAVDATRTVSLAHRKQTIRSGPIEILVGSADGGVR